MGKNNTKSSQKSKLNSNTLPINKIKQKISTSIPKKFTLKPVPKNQPSKISPDIKAQPATPTASQKSKFKLPFFRKLYFKPSYIILGIIVLLLAIFFLRVAIWEHSYINRMEGSERHTAVQSNSENPDDYPEATDDTELTPTEVAAYQVAPDKPRYLTIPSLAGINQARILEVGKRRNGELSTPYNIYDVGWYSGSALPGARGTAIIDGHGGAPGIGVFGNLPLIQPDALIQVEMGDGRVYTYRVVDTATKALGEEADAYMTTAFKSPKTGVPSLTLITCTGDYWLSRRTYSHRFFARAILVE